MPDDPLHVTRSGAVATLWLNRPDKRNAMTLAMWEALARTCTALAADDDVRVLVVRGHGEHFCAGADIGELGQADRERYDHTNREAEEALAGFPKPTIAEIRGSCVGGGVSIAIACDLRIAADDCRFGVTPARLGIVYPPGALDRLVQLIGPSAAKHLLYSAELVDALRALRVGLVDEVHPVDAVGGRVAALAATITERSLLTQVASKAMIAAGPARAPELAARWAAAAAASGESAEGFAAFAEKRPPTFPFRGER